MKKIKTEPIDQETAMALVTEIISDDGGLTLTVKEVVNALILNGIASNEDNAVKLIYNLLISSGGSIVASNQDIIN